MMKRRKYSPQSIFFALLGALAVKPQTFFHLLKLFPKKQSTLRAPSRLRGESPNLFPFVKTISQKTITLRDSSRLSGETSNPFPFDKTKTSIKKFPSRPLSAFAVKPQTLFHLTKLKPQ